MPSFTAFGIDVINNAAVNFTSGTGNDGQGTMTLQGGSQVFADDAVVVFETINETENGELDSGSAFTGITVYASQADFDAGIVQYSYAPQNPGQTANIQSSGDGLGDTYVRFNANVLVSSDPSAPRFGNLFVLPGTDAADNIGTLTIDRNTDVDLNGDGVISQGTLEEGNNLFYTGGIDQVICFTPGTRVATRRGEVLTQQLQVGDKVITRDNGVKEVRWIGRRNLSPQELAATPAHYPIQIKAGALGQNSPQRDLCVSPNHRILLSSEDAQLMFGESEVLIAAKHLTGLPGVDVLPVRRVSYIHVMFDNHEVILANGAWAESFQPGAQSLAGIKDAQRDEIFALFPELTSVQGVSNFTAARRLLKAHEAHLLTLSEHADKMPATR
ncbi:MAG: Hint domain-containing protein [Sulfitobacter sp.]